MPVPDSIGAGDSVSFAIQSPQFGPGLYDGCSFLLAYLALRVTAVGVQGESEETWAFQLTPAQTSSMTAGVDWAWSLQATNVLPPLRVTFDQGVVAVFPDPSAPGLIRPPGIKTLTLQAAMETRRKLVSNEVQTATFLNQTWTRWNLKELDEIIRGLEREADDETAPPGVNTSLVYTRFRKI
jgi:hypothetical protein